MRSPLLQAFRTAKRQAFTLVEILVALTLLGLLTAMLFSSFNAVVRSWDIGRASIDATGHADYIMEQLTAAIRSAYYPGSGEKYGLIFTDDGEGDSARDTIEWSKVGPALIGEDAEFAEVPHRVRVSITDPQGDVPGGFAVRAWRQDFQQDDFDIEEQPVDLVISPKVIAFNCRMLDPDQARTADDEINWIDEWTKTNTLPTALEVTLWMRPADDDEDPIESKRIIELPMGALSQNPNLAASANTEARAGTSTAIGGGHKNHPGQSGGNSPFIPGNGEPPPPGNASGNRPSNGSIGGGGRPGNRPSNPADDLFRPAN